MKSNMLITAVCLLATGCATERQVDRKISALELRRISVETALADRITKVETTADSALATAQSALKLATGKFSYDTVSSTQTFQFKVGLAELDLDQKTRLANLAQQLKTENRNVFLEIQGHTDSIGDDRLNEAVGLRRAEAVRAFLYSQGVALNRMSAVSLGERAPISSNLTPAGRAANRRVEVIIKY